MAVTVQQNPLNTAHPILAGIQAMTSFGVCSGLLGSKAAEKLNAKHPYAATAIKIMLFAADVALSVFFPIALYIELGWVGAWAVRMIANVVIVDYRAKKGLNAAPAQTANFFSRMFLQLPADVVKARA
jgi:hypothetical protein